MSYQHTKRDLNGHFGTGRDSGEQMDLWHHTDEARANDIVDSGGMRGIRGEAYFSNQPHGFYGGDYGPAAVRVRVPSSMMTQDDSFRTGEKFYKTDAANIQPEHIQGIE
jgi:hypothetical protein